MGGPRRGGGQRPLLQQHHHLLPLLVVLLAMHASRRALVAAFLRPRPLPSSAAFSSRAGAAALVSEMVAVAPRSPLWPPPLPLRLYSTVMAAAEQPSTTAHGMTPDGGEQQQLQPQPELQAQGEGQAPQQAKQSPRGRKKKEWQGPLAYHQELTLQVDSLTNLGMGVCRFELEGTGERWVVMVPAVIPGEVVRVKIYRNHKNYSQADLLEVLEPSPDRVEPTCPLFGTCGGCQYQHMRVPAQRAWKQQHVEEVLTRTGNITGSDMRPVNEVFGTSEVLGYRSKITPHHEKPRSGEIRDIGFLKLGSRSLVDVARCEIATPAINARLETLRKEVKAKARKAFEEGSPKKAKGATLFLREVDEGVVTDTREEVSSTVNGLTFKYLAGSFFQNNPFVLPHMVNHVVDQAQAGAGLRFLVDAYCGGGLFCLSASQHFEACYGVEISELAVLSARRNAELNGIHNCHFRAGDATAIFAGIGHLPGRETAVIIDPPRKGCDQDFLTQLFSFRPARVVYVSCDPATQARDARAFVDAGYAMEEIQPFDLFPQTRHIENVIVFRDERFSGVGRGPAAATAAE